MKPKTAYIIGCALAFVALGCKPEPRSAPPPAKTVTDGTNTWFLGAVTVNGTNVPVGGIKVRAITNEPSK